MAVIAMGADPQGEMGAFRRRVVAFALVGPLAAAVTAPPIGVMAAAPNQLSVPTVSPTTGSTTTTFAFGVHYSGEYPAVKVAAVVGSQSIELSLASGSSTNGTYTGSSTLPAGTWTVTFVAVASKRNSPSIVGPTIIVVGPTPVPTPIAVPTAAPTPPPPTTKTLAPTPVPPGATPAAVPASSGSASPAAVAHPGASQDEGAGGVVGNPTPGEGDLVPSLFWPLMLGGLGVIALVVAWSFLAMKRERRRQELAAELAVTTFAAASDTLTAEPPRPKAVWELDAALEEAPVGTVEYLPLEDGRIIGALPDALPEPDGPRRGNLRQARIADARNSRQVEDRRSLLRRS